MMKSLHTERDRQTIIARVRQLTPESRARWGKMTAQQMILHLADSARMATGELPVASKGAPFRFPVVKQLLMYVLPIPKNLPTAPELIARTTTDWDADMADYFSRLEAFAQKKIDSAWADHPVFGPMNGTEWGRQLWSHMDHHLRQFGA
ncbi:MAG: hypothetical protein JWM95_4997 [Gemmatimonadetes bacterium]|nr:hypothetical protein [Gemmatimonadota bacterium]